MKNLTNKIAITIGDPSGIGAEITLKALMSGTFNLDNIIIIGNIKLLEHYSKLLHLNMPKCEIIDLPFNLNSLAIGKDIKESGDFAYYCLEKACKMAINNEIKSIVTAPLSKQAMNLAGHNFSGQTEVLEKFLGAKGSHAEMFFIAGDFRVMLLTRHIPLKDIAKTITQDFLEEKIIRLNNELKNKFNIAIPKIALCSLNPHAGENGLIGNEENTVFKPVITKLKQKNILVSEPVPADALFKKACTTYINKEEQPYDAYLSCYHDQGLIPIKAIAGDKTVNTTIGLKILRTSPAHGTAFDIAGQGIANSSSMEEAIKIAFTCLNMPQQCCDHVF